MSEELTVDVEPKEHIVEGHTKQCYLNFNGQCIWGVKSCHDTMWRLANALHEANPRFEVFMCDKPHSVEGHIATISVKRGDHVYLDRLSTHDNMTRLRDAVRKALIDEDGHN